MNSTLILILILTILFIPTIITLHHTNITTIIFTYKTNNIVQKCSLLIGLIHEIGHCIYIYFTTHTKKYKSINKTKKIAPPVITFKGNNPNCSILKTYSDIYQLFSEEPAKFKSEIKFNALTGTLFEVLLPLSVGLSFILLGTHSKNSIITFVAIVYSLPFMASCTTSVVEFKCNGKSKTSDFYILLHPEEYKYTTLEQDIQAMKNKSQCSDTQV